MITIIMVLLITAVMLVTTISIFTAFYATWPLHWLMRLVLVHPAISLVFNFTISIAIASFFGEGTYAGLSNLLASAIFAIWIEARKGFKFRGKRLKGLPFRAPKWKKNIGKYEIHKATRSAA